MSASPAEADVQSILQKTGDVLSQKRKDALKRQGTDGKTKPSSPGKRAVAIDASPKSITTPSSPSSHDEDESDGEDDKKSFTKDEVVKVEDERRKAVEFERKTAVEAIRLKDPKHGKDITESASSPKNADKAAASSGGKSRSSRMGSKSDADEDDEDADEDDGAGGVGVGGIGGSGERGSIASDGSDEVKGHERAPSRVVWNLNANPLDDFATTKASAQVTPLTKGCEFILHDSEPLTPASPSSTPATPTTPRNAGGGGGGGKSQRHEIVLTYDPIWGGRLGALYWHAKGSKAKESSCSLAVFKLHDVVKGIKPKLFDLSGLPKETKLDEKLCCTLIGETVAPEGTKAQVKILNLEAHDAFTYSKFMDGVHHLLETSGLRLCVADRKERMTVVNNSSIALPSRDGETVKLGFLYKMNLFKKWNERFVQVNGDDLEYYEFDIFARQPFKRAGKVCLIQAVLSEIDADVCHRDHVFAIRALAGSSGSSSASPSLNALSRLALATSSNLNLRRNSDTTSGGETAGGGGGGATSSLIGSSSSRNLKDTSSQASFTNLNALQNERGSGITGVGGGGTAPSVPTGTGISLWQALNDLDREGWKEFLENRIMEVQREDTSPYAEVYTLKTLPPACGGKEGFLDKLGGRLSPKWQVRFFQQTPRALKYYSVHANGADRMDCKYRQAGIIPIEGATVFLPDAAAYGGKAHLFAVRSKGSNKTFVLQARDDNVRHEWVEALEKQAKGELQVDSSYAKVGFMTKMGNRRNKAFKERYWILTHDRLRYFRKAADVKPAGTIPLFAGAVLQRELAFAHGGVTNCFAITPARSKRTYVLCTSTAELRDEWMSAIRRVIEDNEAQHNQK